MIRQPPRARFLFATVWALLLCLFSAGCASNRLSTRDREIIARHNATSTNASHTNGLTGVWKVKGARNTVYLAATSHLITADQVPFPPAFYIAYTNAAELFMEVDPDPSTFARLRFMGKTVKWISKRRSELLLPSGQSLSDQLDPELTHRLRQHYGSEFKRRERFTPLLLAFIAEAEAMAQQSEKHGGVEDAFAALARRDRKPVSALDDRSVEDLAFQALDEMLLTLRAEMSLRGTNAVIAENVLGERSEVREESWQTGDLTAAEAIVAKMADESPALYQQLGPDRNRKWLPKIREALAAKHDIMIFAGLAHFAGPDNLLTLLRAEGFFPEQLPANPAR